MAWGFLLLGANLTININKRGRRIEIRSDGPLPGLRTAIPGAYESVHGYWTVPLSLESCTLLRQRYGKRLAVGSELARWARGVRDSRDYMARLGASSDARLHALPRVAPKLARAMRKRKYQRVGARFIADTHAVLVADEPGLGKTLMAMGGILEAGIPGPYLVIVYPKVAAKLTWESEIKRWLPPDYKVITMPEGRLARERKLALTHFGDNKWLIVHPEMVLVQTFLVCEKCGELTAKGSRQQKVLHCRHLKTAKTKTLDKYSYPELFKVEWGAIIVDESHETLIRRSGVPTQRRNGLDKLKLRTDGIRIAMSGTPYNSRPHLLWGTLNWLDNRTYSAFYRWAELYWQKGGYSGWEIGEFRDDREKMLWDSLDAIAIRRTKAEVAKDLPPKLHVGALLDPSDEHSPIGIWLPMDGEQSRAYEQMLKHSATELESGRLEAITALAELTRLKQFASSYGDLLTRTIKVQCGDNVRPCYECRTQGWHPEQRYKFIPKLPSNKFTWLTNTLEEWGYPKNPVSKVVIVSFYTGLLKMFAAELEKHFRRKPDRPLTTMITGGLSDVERVRRVQRFEAAGNEQILLLNLKAGGTSITLDSPDRMVFLSETRIPDQQTQAEDRIHRVSNPRQCMYYYLRSLNTVDVGTALVNQELAQTSHRLLDGRRGIEYMRHVLKLSR